MGITAGPDGNLWFTDRSSGGAGDDRDDQPDDPRHHRVRRPYTPVPFPWWYHGGPRWQPLVHRYGDDRTIGMINPATHAVTEFPIATPLDTYGIYGGPGWQPLVPRAGIQGSVGEINPTTHALAEFPVPTSVNTNPSLMITAGPDGNIWFTESGHGRIGEINPATRCFTEYPVPSANSFLRRDHRGPRRQPLVHRPQDRSDRPRHPSPRRTWW